MFQAASFNRSATRLSWFGAHFLARTGAFWGLARLSLTAALLSMLSGCLIDDPPPLVAPQQTPPRLDYTKASPGLDQIMNIKQGEVIPFKMPVTSEDAGDDLLAVLLFDYDGLYGLPLTVGSFLPASTLADTNPRELGISWTVIGGIEPGCHRITLRVTHVGNIRTTIFDLVDQSDLAEAYWFANVNVTPQNAGSAVKCPGASLASGAP
jgi:hypothetical protein